MSKLQLFAIGVVASLCSSFLPRISGALAAGGSLTAFSKPVILLSVAFSLIVGVVVMVIQWNEARSPRDVFFFALGVPALISGMASSADGARAAVDAQQRSQVVVEEVRKAADVPIIHPGQPAPGPSSSLEAPSIRLAFVLEEDQYLVVLGPASTRDVAERMAIAWGGKVITREGQEYVELAGPLPKGDALAQAIRWRERGAPAALLKVVAEQGA